MIVTAQLGVEDHQTTTTASNTGAQHFAEAMNTASALHSHPQPGPTPNPQPGPPPGHPGPSSGQYQCDPSKLTKGVAEYSVAGTDAGVGALYTALAAGAGGSEGDPVSAVLVGGLFGGIALWEGISGTVDVVESGCF